MPKYNESQVGKAMAASVWPHFAHAISASSSETHKCHKFGRGGGTTKKRCQALAAAATRRQSR